MNVQDAAFITGHDYPGGAESLGPRIGVGGMVLSHKLNPNNKTHHLTLAETMRIMTLTGDMRILHAMCSELQYMAIPLPTVGDVDVMAAMTATISDFGAYIKASSDALQDNKVTKLELRNINKKMGNLMAQGGKFMALLEAQEASRAR
jgi:hypothetical protein